MSVLVDTSEIYAVLDADDDQHSRAIAEWHRLVRGAFSLVTTSYILVETTALIQHRLGVDAVRALDQDIRPILRVEWIDEDLHSVGMASMLAAASVDLLVNCTSLGMAHGPDPDASPIPAGLIPRTVLVYDLVYNPAETPLLAAARRAGARTLGGLPMLVYQGAAAFRMWTGREAPVDVMMRAASQALAGG